MTNDINTKMEKTINDLTSKIAGLRTSRANPDMLKNISVNYYNSNVSLQQLAAITTPEASQFMLNVFDQGAIKDIEKAILQSELGLTPQTDGTTIRITLPDLTQDRRNQLVKTLKQMGEESKISIRNIRRDCIDSIRSDEKNKEITEDESKIRQDNVQDSTNKFSNKIDALIKQKESELMTI
ncbi:ribosome recycling factor [bacterium]|nr:ribosome recycling factor [bacterium]|tara:strand:- start:1475 stop:2020 length:546 start_codon:yes stop_codon:yes gene_type:complete